jgi:hypothetical protein
MRIIFYFTLRNSLFARGRTENEENGTIAQLPLLRGTTHRNENEHLRHIL